MSGSTRHRHRARWATAAGLSVLAVASGCAQPQAMPPTQAPAGLAAVAGGVKFQTEMRDGHLVCTSCSTVLDKTGRHKASEVLLRALKAMKSGDVFARKAAPAGATTLKDVVVETIAKLGPSKLGLRVPAGEVVDGEYKLLQSFPSYFPYNCPDDQCWRDYVAYHSSGCCIPDGVPAPDGPY